MRSSQRPDPRRPFLLLSSALVAACVLAGAARAQPGEAPPVAAGPASAAFHWRLAGEPVPAEGGLLAVALGPDGSEAAGDARGLLLGGDGGGWRRIALRGAVRDLAFAPDGALWVASDEGLFRLAGDRLAARPPGPGEAARAALRVVAGARAVAVATREGVHWSRDGARFARVEGGFGIGEDDEADDSAATDEGDGPAPADPAAAPAVGLALAEPADPAAPATLWIAAPRGLFRADLAGAGRVRAERVDTPVALRPALDVALAGGAVLALGRDALVVGAGAGAPWRVARPELPPGATPIRVVAGAHGAWIATDRGVVEADRPEAPWRRTAEPAGTMASRALARAGETTLVAAGARGLLRGGRAPLAVAAPPASASAAPLASAPAATPAAGSAAAPPPPGALACDPPIAAVHAAVLARLDLGGARTARMWRGVRRRGALPIVSVDGALSDDDRHYRTWDETFTSGDTRRLFDRDRDRERERAVALRLTWDLGDVAYHPEEIDVSTEQRRTIELRDDVLDEVNQLYFDRRRARAAAAAAADPAEAARERLRAEELAAGLDAWTGGWFGPRADTSPCPAVHP